MLDRLRSLARQVTPFALDLYDRADSSKLLAQLARIVPNSTKQNPLTLEWVTVFPQLRKWVGERVVQHGVFRDNLVVVSHPYEQTFEFDKYEAERPEALVKFQDLATPMARAFARGKLRLCSEVLHLNSPSYDGQNFFDTEHVHPNGKPFSNIIPAARLNPTTPNLAEARDEFKRAQARLLENTLVQETLVDSAAVREGMIVITRSYDVWQVFESLRTEERIGGDPNQFRNGFTLWRDLGTPPELADVVDFISAQPDGPRPVILVETREPNGIAFDESKVFSHQLIPFGMDAEYGVAAGFPQVAVRAQVLGE